MRLGISMSFPHRSPEEWAEKHRAAGLLSVVFPCSHTDDTATIDRYVQAAAAYDLTIAEVGCWSNPNAPDEKTAKAALQLCKDRLALAEYVGASCAVNISGAFGEVWDGGYGANYTVASYEKIVETTREIIDAVHPVKTAYSLEPMPHMLPDSPETYLQLIKDVDRPGFGVHLDVVNMLSSPQRYFDNRNFVDKCFAMLGKYMVSCHLKDCVLTHALPVTIKECECGDGGFDIPHYLAAVDRLNPDLPVIIEHLDNVEKYVKAIEWVKAHCHGV